MYKYVLLLGEDDPDLNFTTIWVHFGEPFLKTAASVGVHS
jgi:hypothetical protein